MLPIVTSPYLSFNSENIPDKSYLCHQITTILFEWLKKKINKQKLIADILLDKEMTKFLLLLLFLECKYILFMCITFNDQKI